MKKKYILDSVGLYKGYLKFYTLETLSVSIIICSLFLHRTHNKSIKNSGFLSPITFNSKTEAIKLFLFSTTGRCSSKYPLLTSCNLSQSNMKCCNVSFSSLHNLHILADSVPNSLQFSFRVSDLALIIMFTLLLFKTPFIVI